MCATPNIDRHRSEDPVRYSLNIRYTCDGYARLSARSSTNKPTAAEHTARKLQSRPGSSGDLLLLHCQLNLTRKSALGSTCWHQLTPFDMELKCAPLAPAVSLAGGILMIMPALCTSLQALLDEDGLDRERGPTATANQQPSRVPARRRTCGADCTCCITSRVVFLLVPHFST